jgi:hypothetical protein
VNRRIQRRGLNLGVSEYAAGVFPLDRRVSCAQQFNDLAGNEKNILTRAAILLHHLLSLRVKTNTVHWVTSIYVYCYAAPTCHPKECLCPCELREN